MDRKSIALLVACFAVLVFLPKVLERFFPPVPVPLATNAVATATAKLAGGTNPPQTGVVPNVARLSAAPTSYVVNTNLAEQVLVVTNLDARYVFTSRGGGLKQVDLLRFPESTSSRRQKVSRTGDFATLHTPVAPPVLAILGSAGETLQGDGVFTLSALADGVRAEKALANGLTIVKDFHIGSNYLVAVSVTLANHATAPLLLPEQEWVVGAATPMNLQDNGMAVNVLWYNATKAATEQVAPAYFNTNTSSFIFFSRTPQVEYHAGANNVGWVASQNQFFLLAAMLTNPAPALTVRPFYLPPPSEEELRTTAQAVAAPKGLQAALNYPAQALAPGQSLTRHLDLFAGPKEYHTLADLGDRANNNIDLVMGFTGFWGTCAKPLLLAMNGLHSLLRLPYGWSIVTITVVLKIVFWPLTAYSTRSMKKMSALAPQVKALQEKYKDDPTKFSQKQWELWKQNKVSPLSGCLPMLLQIPVLGGFYRMLQSAVELRGEPFLWIGDLSRPDTIYTLFLPIPLPILGSTLAINPMPLLMGVTMLWQSHLTPPSPGMDPAQQKMMRYLPLIFLVIMYNFSSGLALYWTVQNLLTILQTKLTLAKADPAPVPVAVSRKK